MKKIVFPRFSKIALSIAVVLLLVNCLLRSLEKTGVHIYFSVMSTREISPNVEILCIVLLVIAFVVLIFNNIHCRGLCIALTVIISFLILIFCMLICFSSLSFESKYYEFTSDYNDHCIVVNESPWLLGGGGTIYEKTSFCTIKEIGTFSTDDGFCPFSNGAYFFVWNEDNFELHYSIYGYENEFNGVVEMEYVN